MEPNLHLWLIPVLPLAGAAINGLFGRHYSNRVVTAVALACPGAAFVYALWVASQFAGFTPAQVPHIEVYASWFRAGTFTATYGLYLDQLSLVMTLVVTGVGFLIHVYSVGYMAHEGGYYRFFAYLNLFMFFMLTLVLAENYLLMFVGWEGVGLASYLLIGFFFLRDSAASAGKKAFIVNRIGDFGFILGLFLMIRMFGSLDFTEVFGAVAKIPVETAGAGAMTALALLLFVGATGKSAQLPLYVWLPDAMEGPTPVSALIHAATMVTAGVYMVARSHAIFDRSPIALSVVATVGVATALFAATIALVQTDIKRVLAYSTISQLGYMFLGCGVAAYTAGIFHLMTHAFFKALLFLAAGSVIHALGGEQDMRKMGGLRRHTPWTFWTMTMATLAIAGAPLFSGFFSKDEILWRAYSSPYGGAALWAVGVFTAFLTSFYMFRLWFLTFFGEFRGEVPEEHGEPQHGGHGHGGGIHESPWVMVIPLALLAVLSVVGGYAGVPESLGGHNAFEKFLSPAFVAYAENTPASAVSGHGEAAPAEPAGLERKFTLAASSAGILGFLLSWFLYYRRRDLPEKIAARLRGAYDLLSHKYWVDEIYAAVFVKPLIDGSREIFWKGVDVAGIDGAVNGAAAASRRISDALRRMQSGNIRSYAGWVAAGAACLAVYMLYLGFR